MLSPVLSKLFNPVRRAAVAFFKHDLALRKDPAGLQIVLESRAVTPAPAKKPKKDSRAELAARREKQDLALILEQLGGLLAELPETRSALRHLVFVEHALQKKGVRALHKLPLDVLQRAHEQLESLVVNWSPVGLARCGERPNGPVSLNQSMSMLQVPRMLPSPSGAPT